MSKLLLSYLFKTNLASFRSAILDENTDKICRILDFERDFLKKSIDTEGNTALLLAIEYTSPLTVRLLLDHGAEPDQPNINTSKTPLGILASRLYDDCHSPKAQRTLEMAKILLDYGAYVDKPIPCIYNDENNIVYPGKETPLMIAVRQRNIPLAKLLIERKANVNYIERHSEIRPIHYAISNGDETMFDLLENAGALLSTIVVTGNNTLLHWFCCKKENDKHMSLLKKLLNKGVDVNAQNWQQRTPLMIAVRNNMTDTCRLLLQNDADTEKLDYNGNQAIDLSVPGSECSRILLHVSRTEKFHLQLLTSPKNTFIRKQRLDSIRRRTTELTGVNNSETKNRNNPSGKDKSMILSPRLFIRTSKIKESDETDNECQLDKPCNKKQTPLLLKKFQKHRAISVDAETVIRL